LGKSWPSRETVEGPGICAGEKTTIGFLGGNVIVAVVKRMSGLFNGKCARKHIARTPPVPTSGRICGEQAGNAFAWNKTEAFARRARGVICGERGCVLFLGQALRILVAEARNRATAGRGVLRRRPDYARASTLAPSPLGANM